MTYHTLASASLLIALATVAGCNTEQLATLEAERDVLAAEVQIQTKRVEALKSAVKQAEAAGDEAQKKELDAALVLVEERKTAAEKQKQAIETVLAGLTRPEDVVEGAGQAAAPLLPPPFNAIVPLITAALAGEIARRRGNAKVRKVAEVLETTGAVQFGDGDTAMAANELMGAGLNAEIAKGRSAAQKKINDAKRVLNLSTPKQ